MKLKVVVVDLEVPARVKKWGLRLGIPLAVLFGGGAVAYAAGLVTWTSGQTLTAQDLNNDFGLLETAIGAIGTVVEQHSDAVQSGATSSDVIYGGMTLTLTPGTWLVLGDASLSTTVSIDEVQLGLYNATAGADFTDAKGAIATTTNLGLTVDVTVSKVLTVTANTAVQLHGYRNGVSALSFGSTNPGIVLTGGARLAAVRLQ